MRISVLSSDVLSSDLGLRLEVRDEATQRYRAKQEPEDSEPLVRLVAEVLEAEPEKQPRIERVLPWDSTLWLSAQRKTGKTTILVNMAYALLTGEKFLGECAVVPLAPDERRSEEHTSELQSLMRISYAVF